MIFNMLTAWWRRLWRRRRVTNVIFVESMTSVPEHLGSDVYIVRRGGFDRRAVLDCPCRSSQNQSQSDQGSKPALVGINSTRQDFIESVDLAAGRPLPEPLFCARQ